MLIFFLLPCTVTPLKCFECHMVEHSDYFPNKSLNICENFDYSETFVTNCENSTYCRKTVIIGDISGIKVGIERGCAKYAYNFIMKYDRYGILYKNLETIADAYSEGCSVSNSHGIKSVSTQHCYCNTDLCNSAVTVSFAFFTFTLWIPITLL